MTGNNFILGQFPESLFPMTNESGFKKMVADGFDVCRQSSVVICGLCRDIINILPNTMARLHRTCSFFRDARIVIVENDSIDGTTEELMKHAENNDRISLIHPKLRDIKKYNNQGAGATGFARVAKMATLRNVYLDEIEKLEGVDYVIVIDLDIDGGWSYEGLVSSFGYEEWSAMTSNGLLFKEEKVTKKDKHIYNKTTKIFYDTWTFREVGQNKFKGYTLHESLFLERGSSPVEVWSNFGGVGIYRYQDIIGCEYRPYTKYEDTACEHVSLHEQIRSNGGRVFINPSLITLYSPTEYCETKL